LSEKPLSKVSDGKVNIGTPRQKSEILNEFISNLKMQISK